MTGNNQEGRSSLTGGCVFRRRPQLIFANHLCCFTSEAPLLLPNLFSSSLSRRRVITSRQDLVPIISFSEIHNVELYTHCETFGDSRKWTGMLRMLVKVSLRSCPLNGVVAYWNAKADQNSVHRDITDTEWQSREMTPSRDLFARNMKQHVWTDTYNHLVNQDP